MSRLHLLLKKQALLGLVLCASAWVWMGVAPTPAVIVLAFISFTLFLSQLNFAEAHATAELAQAATRATFHALPDAVLVVDRRGALQFCKDTAIPYAGVLPLVAPSDVLREDLLAMVGQVLMTQTSQQIVVHISAERFLECRGTPFNEQEVLIIIRDVTETHKDSERIRYMATRDGLTGLLNRNSFHASIDKTIARARRSGSPFGLLFIDLDYFKAVNDTLGHEAGDSVLRLVAERLLAGIRQSDTAYRLAGDEFTVIAEQLGSESDIQLVATKLCASLAQPYFDDLGSPAVSASIGVAIYPRDGTDAEGLLHHADKAMYRAKSRGRNQISTA